jgi:hypothetical protein
MNAEGDPRFRVAFFIACDSDQFPAAGDALPSLGGMLHPMAESVVDL